MFVVGPYPLSWCQLGTFRTANSPENGIASAMLAWFLSKATENSSKPLSVITQVKNCPAVPWSAETGAITLPYERCYRIESYPDCRLERHRDGVSLPH